MPGIGGFTAGEWLVLIEHELLLFACIFFALAALDEMLIDATFLWLRLTGRAPTRRVDRAGLTAAPLKGQAAVFIPAWQEAQVIGLTIGHALASWRQRDLRLYVGCYRNDPATLEAAMQAAQGDPRLRLVILDHDGPSTKADCLNRLYEALCEDELRSGTPARMIVLHDAEDMADPAALGLLDQAMDHADFVQLPVIPQIVEDSRWVSAHYCEEFAEAHCRTMVVRDALGAALPAAGVGCAFSRTMIARLARQADRKGAPFSSESLTEDYELGLRIKLLGGRSRFLRLRGEDGRLIGTRACFPASFEAAIRQKSRWIHGIALQGWDRLGWSRSLVDVWMRLHDRRGPMVALVLACAYLLLLLGALHLPLRQAGLAPPMVIEPALMALLAFNMASFGWRAAWRFLFTAREYGWSEGLRAVLRIPLANLIAILAGRRALLAYVGTLRGQRLRWEKTRHADHPVLMRHRQALP